jgi:hypothetical protein
MELGSSTATMFAAWTVELSKLASVETGQPHWRDWAFLRSAYLTGDSSCGDTATSCAEQAASAMNAAAERLGRRPPDWGEGLHQAAFSHPVLSSSMLGCLVDRLAAHGGDDSSINVGGFDLTSDDFRQTAGPSYRQIIDVGSLGEPLSEWCNAPVRLQMLYLAGFGHRFDYVRSHMCAMQIRGLQLAGLSRRWASLATLSTSGMIMHSSYGPQVGTGPWRRKATLWPPLSCCNLNDALAGRKIRGYQSLSAAASLVCKCVLYSTFRLTITQQGLRPSSGSSSATSGQNAGISLS